MKFYIRKLVPVIAITAFLAIILSSCKPVTTISPGSQATGTPTNSVSPTAQLTPGENPDPGSIDFRVENAYPNLTFDQPLYITLTGGSSSEIYVVERPGIIKVFTDSVSTAEAQTFLDISNLVNDNGQEKGLLGLAFHPNYDQNGYFYVNYTNADNTIIARYKRNDSNSLTADNNSGVVILSFRQPYSNHNGGHLAFGPDGFLYIATGDGGSGGDPHNNAQNLSNYLGKILRIDVDNPAGGVAYGVPLDNPFIGNSNGYLPEIFSYGLRNPWRFSFDSQGNLWAGDVGQDNIEEVDLITKGGNFGWSAREGTHDYKTIAGLDLTALIAPVWEYDHSLGQSITGGYIYEGSLFPALQGTYVYGDYISGRIWALWIDENSVVHNVEIIETDLNIASFGLDAAGEILIVDLEGEIYRLNAIPSY